MIVSRDGEGSHRDSERTSAAPLPLSADGVSPEAGAVQPEGWGVIRRSASRLRFRFRQVKLNDHSSFGVRRLVAAMVLGVSRKAATSRRTPYGLVICPSFARILTRTFNCNLKAELQTWKRRP